MVSYKREFYGFRINLGKERFLFFPLEDILISRFLDTPEAEDEDIMPVDDVVKSGILK